MVSFWPFKSDDTSAAHFEKTLSTLSGKLQRANERDTLLRTRARRLKALWTLYTVFAYILIAAILALVTGYANWGPPEYAAVSGGPVLIYTVRVALTTYYDYRIGTNKAYIKEVSTQRRAAIERFKAATKYGETQQLLEKYGDEKSQKAKGGDEQDDEQQQQRSKKPRKSEGPRQPPPQRTNLLPPPTANIQRPVVQQPPMQGPGQGQNETMPPETPLQQPPASPMSPAEGAFSPTAPGAAAPAQYVAPPAQPQWYDRLLDVLLGDDETKPIHRLALICEQCRLVNGQAPAGVKDLSELGRWRCGGCKAWNGEVSEVKKLFAEADEPGEKANDTGAEDVIDEAVEQDKSAEQPPARSTRSKTAKGDSES